MELGGNITLTGFNEREFAEIIVVKKLVGQYARKLHDSIPEFSHLSVTLKSVGTNQVELHAKAEVDGGQIAAAASGRNLFVALDAVLKKIVAQAKH